MQVLVNRDGTRNRDYRPYIDGEELYRNVPLYDPNGKGPHYGLYDSAQPACQSWTNQLLKYEKHNNFQPAFVIDRNGISHYYQNPTIGQRRVMYTGGGVQRF